MRGDIPQAALNLLARLPVRVNTAPEPQPVRRTDDRAEYHRVWHDNNRTRRNAYQAEKQREYRQRRRAA